MNYVNPCARAKKIPRPAVPLPEVCGCVLSAWFTFIYRTTGLHAVGSWGWSLLYAVSRSYRLTWVAPRKALPYLPSPFVIIVYHRLNGLSIVFLKKFCRPGRLHLSLMQVQLPCFYCRCQRCGRRRLRTIVLLPFINVIPLFNLYGRGSDHSPRKCSLVRSFHKVG